MSARPAVPLAIVIYVAAIRTPALSAQQPTLTNGIGMEFVLMSPGRMLVGRFQPECPRPSPAAVSQDPTMNPRARWTPDDYARCDEMAKRDAMPGFMVTIARPYYIGKYEVTQAEWKRVMGTNPSVFQGSKVRGDADRHPVDNVTWADAQAFVRRLNAMDTTGRYRLPTEFEWEYAARAGATGEPSWDEIRESAWEQDVDLGTTHPVGGKKPNAWGLCDTLGNVWEWVADHYNERLFADPVPPTTVGKTHVLKGGSFVSDVKNTTWSTHAGGPGSGFDVGMRIVREVP
jgi:formylglycine-generating enzyme required for sulfatase activity